MAIRVLLADDHGIVRQGLRVLLESDPEIAVIGEAQDGLEAVQYSLERQPDVLIMDLAMPHLGGLEAIRQIRQKNPKIKIIILSMYADEGYIVAAVRNGASGYIIKDALAAELRDGIKEVYQGKPYFSASIDNERLNAYLKKAEAAKTENFELLTPREKEVLKLIAQGQTNQEIAERLLISIKTVETHRTNIMKKLDLHTKAELTRYAITKRLISLQQ